MWPLNAKWRATMCLCRQKLHALFKVNKQALYGKVVLDRSVFCHPSPNKTRKLVAAGYQRTLSQSVLQPRCKRNIGRIDSNSVQPRYLASTADVAAVHTPELGNHGESPCALPRDETGRTKKRDACAENHFKHPPQRGRLKSQLRNSLI